jgi:hypothetical protein
MNIEPAPLVNLYHNSAPIQCRPGAWPARSPTSSVRTSPPPRHTPGCAGPLALAGQCRESSTGLVTVENFAFSERMGVRFKMKDIADPRRLKKRVRKEVGEFMERYVRKLNPDEDVLVRAIAKPPTDRRKLHIREFPVRVGMRIDGRHQFHRPARGRSQSTAPSSATG